MRYVSLFSGIEAVTVATEPLGWEPVAFAEIEPFPCAVLAHHWPDVPNLGDVTKIDWTKFKEEHGTVDLVAGGSPCQSFSIAGGRESLAGESALCFEYWRAVRDLRPRWFLWENVPGVFSTRDNAFGQFLGKMEELGYGMAWRTLDAQFFGVAQRRRRVFLVGHLGDGGGAAAVLFDADSVRGNTKSSREKRQELARAAGVGASIGGGESLTLHQNASVDVHVAENQCGTLMASASVSRQQILVDGEPSVLAFDTTDITNPAAQYTPRFGNVNRALCATQHPPAIALQSDSVMAFDTTQITSPENGNRPQFGNECHTLNANAHVPAIAIRRLDLNQQPRRRLPDGRQRLHAQLHRQAERRVRGRRQRQRRHGRGHVRQLEGGGGCSVNSNGDDLCGTLAARDFKGVGNQYVEEGKLTCQPTR